MLTTLDSVDILGMKLVKCLGNHCNKQHCKQHDNITGLPTYSSLESVILIYFYDPINPYSVVFCLHVMISHITCSQLCLICLFIYLREG